MVSSTMTKVNIDGSAASLPNPASCGEVFRTYRGFIHGCFTSPLPILHALDVGLARLIKSLELSNYWSPLWIKARSIL